MPSFTTVARVSDKKLEKQETNITEPVPAKIPGEFRLVEMWKYAP